MFRSRYGKAASTQHKAGSEDADEESANSEDEEQSDHEGRIIMATKPTTNNHYTLNLTSNTPVAKLDLPYALSGSVFWSPLLVLS